MRILQIAFLLSVCWCPQALSLAISDIMEITKLSKDVVIDLMKTFKIINEDVGLFKEIKVMRNKIDMFSAQMGISSRILYAMVAYTDIEFELKRKLMEVIKDIDFINLKYRNMGTFIESKAAYEDLTLEEFARSIVSSINSSLQSVLDRIHAIIAPEEDDHYEEDEDYNVVGVPSVFKILHEIMKVQGNKLFCNLQTSEQQLLLNLYNTMALTELKGFLMIKFSYMLLKLHNRGNFNDEIKAAQERYKDRSERTLNLTMGAVTWAEYDLWKCDPSKQVKNETYIEITELLQGYIENKEDLNDIRACYQTCKYFNDTKSYNCKNYGGQNMFCTKNRQCKGKIRTCQDIADATVCLADAGTNRRYEYIDQSGKRLGHWKDCGYNKYNNANFMSWGSWFSTCDYCMCLCDEQGVNSDRYFSMRSIESDVDHNKVVTGLRFVKKNRIIHLQIQQGKLLPRAQIDVATVHWKPVEDYRIDGPGVSDGLDYHTLTWEKRSFDLDNLGTEYDELVTGVRFQMVGSHLSFQIHVTAFNLKTGILDVGKTRWCHSQTSQNYRRKLNLDNKDIRSPVHSLPLSEGGMYLEFTHSDLVMDVAQTTVPFIDAQAVASAMPVPLSGAGVMYKGSKDFAGFIYPTIRTFYSGFPFNTDDDTNFGKK